MPLPPRDHRLASAASPTLLDLVARRARASSDGLLVACAVLGLVAATTVVAAWPDSWAFALPGLVMAGVGGWGVADRAASELGRGPVPSPVTLGLLRAVRLAAGVMAAAALVGFVLAMALRTVITAGGGWF
ncbi:MAG: hypothetical protein ACYC2G_08815 [Gemmatimonadaceae bacterium]